jgi:hypothetical protein
MARMVRDWAASTDDDEGHGWPAEAAEPSRAAGVANATDGVNAPAAADAVPQEVAGLPLVDRPPMSAEDVEVLREYLGSRRQKLARSGLRLSGFAAVVVTLLVLFDGMFVLRVIGVAILAFALIFALAVMADWRRQRVLVEADLREGYLCRYEGVVPESRGDHTLVKGGLLRAHAGSVQRIDVLPVSRKLHRTNGSLQWTWCQVRD